MMFHLPAFLISKDICMTKSPQPSQSEQQPRAILVVACLKPSLRLASWVFNRIRGPPPLVGNAPKPLPKARAQSETSGKPMGGLSQSFPVREISMYRTT
jgi:hypothetical protein